METFEIRDDEIDVEEIMQKIRENIRMRREAGIYPEIGVANPAPSSTSAPPYEDQEGEQGPISLLSVARRDLGYINSNWDVENKGYFISSHRPVTGKFLITGRELVHGEVRRYVDPAIWKQKEFNGRVVRLLNEVARSVEQISAKLTGLEDALLEVRSEISKKSDVGEIDRMRSELLGAIEAEISRSRSEIDASIAQLDTEIEERIDAKVGQARAEIDASIAQLDTGVEERIKRETNAFISAMNQDIQKKAWLASILEGRLKDFEDIPLSSDVHSDYEGINYFVFEEAFRGPREEITARQAAFVRYFEGAKNVLDIGCGRGEFLGLLREGGIGGRGIDLNEDMVAYCRSKGLDVERIDAVTYLESLEDKSLDGVFVDQVVEHLQPDYLVKMLGLCYNKLKYGHYIVVETVNPLSFTSLSSFYMDLTHVRPMHPYTLKFLLKSVKFRELEVGFFTPLLDESRLKKLAPEIEIDGWMRRLVERYDRNVDILNNSLYGPQDYAVIGKK